MAERVRMVALVPAAGGGRRFGGEAPKQYALLAGRALLACTLDRLASALSPLPVVVALAPDDNYYDAVIGERAGVETLRCGGDARAMPTRLPRWQRDAAMTIKFVHDAARPCVPVDAVLRLTDKAHRRCRTARCAIADTLKRREPIHSGRAPAEERAVTAGRRHDVSHGVCGQRSVARRLATTDEEPEALAG
jgi:2-C-methyl-D-erythritol 4-phosphate cytidylyltransferase